jgi:hypothetical protein
MTTNIASLERQLHNRRSAVIMGLVGLVGVHIMDLPGKWTETFYLAVMYLGVIAFGAFLIERLIVKVSSRDYLAAALLSTAVLGGYIVNRSVGMPGAMGDIGNWFEPLGLLSIAIEMFSVWHSVAGYVIYRRLARLANAAQIG